MVRRICALCVVLLVATILQGCALGGYDVKRPIRLQCTATTHFIDSATAVLQRKGWEVVSTPASLRGWKPIDYSLGTGRLYVNISLMVNEVNVLFYGQYFNQLPGNVDTSSDVFAGQRSKKDSLYFDEQHCREDAGSMIRSAASGLRTICGVPEAE